ncbi:MAG: metallophosphoesterase [Desulfurococcales archaeon]|nr:metallophosphoesterase [Desulfurococcales archaeon]
MTKRPRVKPLLLAALLLIPIIIQAPITHTQQGNATLPNINKEAYPNPLYNIGPGAPAIAGPGETVTITLKPEYSQRQVTGITLIQVKLGETGLALVKVQPQVQQINETSYKITLPSDIEPGLYDMLISLDDGSTLVSARSLWVLTPDSIGDVIRFVHMSDLHYGAGTPSPEIGQMRRFTGLLLSQLVGANAILDTGDEADTQAPQQYMNSLAFRYDFAYPVPFILNPGNHDYPNGNFFKYYEKTMAYFTIGGKILIVYINTDGENGYADWRNLQFLKHVLEEYKDLPYKFVMMHHPVFYYQGQLYTRSDTNSTILANPREASNSAISYYWGSNVTAARYFLRLCEDYNITLVLAGHIHRDQYVEFHSTRTGTVTRFQTTTTLAHGTGIYQGLQVFDFNTTSGEITYPLAPPWFIGYKNYSRTKVYNSIPITRPEYSENWKPDKFGDTFFYGTISQGSKALVITLENMLPYLDVDKTVLISLPWPADYPVNLEVLNTTGGSAEIVDQLRVDELNRTFIALHVKLPPKTTVKFALYTVEDSEPPTIELKTTIPKTPKVNKTIKAYIKISDEGWGVSNAEATINTSTGKVKVFKFEKYSGTTYLAKFIVESKYKATVTITVEAEDYAGHKTAKTLTINLAGPEPPPPPTTTTTPPTTTTTTTPPPTTTTTQTTTTTSLTCTTTSQPPQETTSTTPPATTTSTTAQPPTPTTTTKTEEKSTAGLAAVAVIILIVIAAIALYMRR